MKNTRLERYLSYILEHPEDLKIKIDTEGWIDVQQLIERINKQTIHKIDRSTFEDFVEIHQKKYVFTGNREFVKIYNKENDFQKMYKITKPPVVLFHGTAEADINIISSHGIKPIDGQYVYLFDNEDTARENGSKNGRPAVIEIDTRKMFKHGEIFYKGINGVWLTSYVSPRYIMDITE